MSGSSLEVLAPVLPVSPDGDIFEVLVVGTVFEVLCADDAIPSASR